MGNWKVGIAPLPLFLLTEGLTALDCLGGKLPNDIVVMVATLAFFGFACGELGKRLPMPGKFGTVAICATFTPSALVHYGLLLGVAVESTTKFYKSTNILYLYICCVIVGSIMSMNHTMLVQGFLKIFFPMLCDEVVDMLVGIGVSMLLGMKPFQVLFLIMLSIMADGMGEGAIPLSMGHATLIHMERGVALGRILPTMILSSLTAIVISGCLSQLGKRSPHLTDEGQLVLNRSNETRSLGESKGASGKTGVETLTSGALLAVLLYMMGVLGHKLIDLPASVGTLFLAVLLRLVSVVSPRLQERLWMVYRFPRTAVTYLILFVVGVAVTPRQELVNAFTLTNLLVIISIVSALVAAGLSVGKKIGVHPIDVVIVSYCQSGQGGTGDVAVPTVDNRVGPMPLAQIATRIGRAINASLGLLFLSRYLA